MYSRRGSGDIEVPSLRNRSGTLLFVQVGCGIMSRRYRPSAQIVSSRTFRWLELGEFMHQV